MNLSKVFNFKEQELISNAIDFRSTQNWSDAKEVYTHLISLFPQRWEFYNERSFMNRYIGDYAASVRDLNTSIRLNPGCADLYWQKAAVLSQYSSESKVSQSKQNRLLLQAKTLLETSKQLKPECQEVWVDLMEKAILTRNFFEAIGFFGESKPYISSNPYILVREWLGSLAYAFIGREIEDKYLFLMEDHKIRINSMAWCTVEIERFLCDLQEEKFNPEFLKRANEIHFKFLSHFKDGDIAFFYKPYHEWLKNRF